MFGPRSRKCLEEWKRGVHNWVGHGITGLAAAASLPLHRTSRSFILLGERCNQPRYEDKTDLPFMGNNGNPLAMCSIPNQTWTRFDLTLRLRTEVDQCTVPGSYTDPDVALALVITLLFLLRLELRANGGQCLPPRS